MKEYSEIFKFCHEVKKFSTTNPDNETGEVTILKGHKNYNLHIFEKGEVDDKSKQEKAVTVKVIGDGEDCEAGVTFSQNNLVNALNLLKNKYSDKLNATDYGRALKGLLESSPGMINVNNFLKIDIHYLFCFLPLGEKCDYDPEDVFKILYSMIRY